LIHSIKGLAEFAHVGRKAGIVDAETDAFVMESIFSTLTNVQFSETRMEEFIKESVDRRDNMKAALEKAGEPVPAPNAFNAWMPEEDLIAQGDAVGIQPRMEKDDADVVSLQEMVTYGIKGVAAYAAHCLPYGGIPDEAPKYIYEAFSYLTKPVEEQTVGDLVGLSLMCGATNLATMGALYDGHSKHFGAPTPTPVRMTPKEGKAIVVSGHDLHMLEDILLKTEGKGINVYTHGEMLPAHGYPGLSKFDHLVGHYGGAWQNQQKQFAKFPGAILMTTNCIMPPTDTYADRIFTTSVVGVDGSPHASTYDDFDAVVRKALELPGFRKDADEETFVTGFGHEAVLSHAGTILECIGDGRIKNFFVVGGCDGSKGERSYYTDLVKGLPKDSVVLTLGCGKYRLLELFEEMGTVEGTPIPRLLDLGQCNDTFSGVQIAVALAEALDTDVGSLPLHFVLSWFEQKAVAVLLSLLHLGIQNIRIGPALPAWVTPNVLNVLVENFNLTPIGEPEAYVGGW
jgi:hydroxylamine reductase